MSSMADEVKRAHVAAKGQKGVDQRRKLRARLRMSYFSDKQGGGTKTVESVEVRRRILMICKQSYWNQFEQGMLSRTAAQYLRSLSDAGMDEECILDEWAQIEEYLRKSGQLAEHHKKGGKHADHGPAAPPHPPLEQATRFSMGSRASMSSMHSTMHNLLTNTTTVSEWQQLSLRGKIDRFTGSFTWTLIVAILVILSTTLTFTSGASSLASISNPSTLAPSALVDPSTYTLTALQYVSIFVRLAVCTLFTAEMILRMVVQGSLVKVLQDLFLLVLIVVNVLDIVSLLEFDAVNGVAQYANNLRLLMIFKHVGIRRALANLKQAQERIDRSVVKAPGGKMASQLSWAGLTVSLGNLVKRLSRRLRETQYRFSFNVLSGFLVAREAAVDLLSELIAEEQVVSVRTIFASAVMAINEDISSVRGYLVLLRQEDYELHAASITMIAARTVLNAQRRAVRHLHHEGILDKSECDTLAGTVDEAMAKLMRSPPDVRFPDNLALLRRVAWLRDCPVPLLQALLDGNLSGGGNKFEVTIAERMVAANGEVVRQGELTDGVFILKRGTLLVIDASFDQREIEIDQLLLGASFNELAFAIKQPATHTVRAAGQATVMYIPGVALRQLVAKAGPTVQEAMWKAVGKQAAEGAVSRGHANLAKWQIERMVQRLEPHLVGDEVLEVQLVQSAVVVLVTGACSIINTKNAMVDFDALPYSKWDAATTSQIKAPNGTNLFVTMVFAPGSRFVAEEGSIQSQEVRRPRGANAAKNVMNLLRKRTPGAGLTAQLLARTIAAEKKAQPAMFMHMNQTKTLDDFCVQQRASSPDRGAGGSAPPSSPTVGFKVGKASGLSGWQSALVASVGAGRQSQAKRASASEDLAPGPAPAFFGEIGSAPPTKLEAKREMTVKGLARHRQRNALTRQKPKDGSDDDVYLDSERRLAALNSTKATDSLHRVDETIERNSTLQRNSALRSSQQQDGEAELEA